MEKPRWSAKLTKQCIVLIAIILLSACSRGEQIRHIEVFVVETLEENDEGFFVSTGYKKVNAITTVEEGRKYIKSDVQSVEDYYDTEGSYIKTVIMHSKAYQSNITITDDGSNRSKELSEPSTILIPDDHDERFQLNNMSEDEQEKVKEHVLSFMDMLG